MFSTLPSNPFPPSTEQMNKGDNTELNNRVHALETSVNGILNGTTIDSFGDVETALTTKASNEIIAPLFDETSGVYAVGDLVVYDGELYQFTSAHETAGAWDSSEVSAVKVSEELATLKSGLNDVNSNIASLLTSYSTTSLTGVKYVKLGKLVCVTFDDVELSSTTVLGLPISNNNIVLILRDQTVGGIVSVTMASNATINSAAGHTNFVAGHKYAGSVTYLSND